MGEEEQRDRTPIESEPLVSTIPEEFEENYIIPLEQNIANSRQRCLFTLFYPETTHVGMSPMDVTSVRALMDCKCTSPNADLLIHSGGGDIHTAYKLAKLFQKKCKNLTALIPEYAKSAATLLAIGCNDVKFSAIAEIGPLDPVVVTGDSLRIPGFSIRDAPKILEEEIESCEDPEVRELKAEYVIGPMAAKLDPYLLTTVKNTSPLAHNYGKKLLTSIGYSSQIAERILKRLVFETGRPSHGYVIDLDEAITIGLNATEMDDDTENDLLNLLQAYRVYELRSDQEGSSLNRPIFRLTKPESRQTTLKTASELESADQKEDLSS